jgi:hypothetical protein
LDENTVAVKTVVLQDEMYYNGEKLLEYKIEYPEFKAPIYQMTITLINRFYRAQALEFQHRVVTELFNMAVEQYKNSIEHGYPVMMYEAMQVFQMTYNYKCIISLFFDRYTYTGGAHGRTIRSSQTWNLQKGYMLTLRRLFRCPEDYKAYIFAEITRQIQENPEIYFEDYPKLIVQTFNEESFYCTPDGIVIYYQQYDIAPYSSGIREFSLPYNACVTDPGNLCFALNR